MKPTALQLGPASDADFTTEILIQLKSGEAFTLFLTDSGYAQIEGKFKALPILDTKKIPLYMHILFYACIIAVGFSAILSNQVSSFFYGFLLSLDTLYTICNCGDSLAKIETSASALHCLNGCFG
jgi:hypothetical protein